MAEGYDEDEIEARVQRYEEERINAQKTQEEYDRYGR